MGISLEPEVVERLSYRGVLAYVASQVLGNGCWTTAQLAQTVNCNSSLMLEGLQELTDALPELVHRMVGRKWPVGTGEVDPAKVQILDSEQGRRTDFLDDLKIYWEHRNSTNFTMSAADAAAVKRFLKQHKDWDRPVWRLALNNRGKSEVNHSQPLYLWLARLEEYSAGPIDRFGKPLAGGIGGKHGKAIETEQRNRDARERAVSGYA